MEIDEKCTFSKIQSMASGKANSNATLSNGEYTQNYSQPNIAAVIQAETFFSHSEYDIRRNHADKILQIALCTYHIVIIYLGAI